MMDDVRLFNYELILPLPLPVVPLQQTEVTHLDFLRAAG